MPNVKYMSTILPPKDLSMENISWKSQWNHGIFFCPGFVRNRPIFAVTVPGPASYDKTSQGPLESTVSTGSDCKKQIIQLIHCGVIFLPVRTLSSRYSFPVGNTGWKDIIATCLTRLQPKLVEIWLLQRLNFNQFCPRWATSCQWIIFPNINSAESLWFRNVLYLYTLLTTSP